MFKTLFKFYKNKSNQPDIEILEQSLKTYKSWELPEYFDLESFHNLGISNPHYWKVYEHVSRPGLLVVKNVFTNAGQAYWIRRCLVDYPKPPNPNNLSPVGLLSNDENWYDVCLNDEGRKSSVFRKLRWVTLGYHHNWDTKVYSEDKRNIFPQDLALLSQTVAKIILGSDFSAEAAIINYYYHNSTINGHTDHSEPNIDAPLLSFSFGDSAIFLIGGQHQDDPASAIFVKSGDVVIMSGQSRLSIHGVPRIIPADEQPWKLQNDNITEESGSSFINEYISLARINMNVRQVLFSGEKRLF